MKLSMYISLFLVFCGVVPAILESRAERIEVLIVDGFSNHDWQRNTAMLVEILESHKRFAIEIATCPSDNADAEWESWLPEFEKYDAVIQTCNDLRNNGSWPVPVQKAFERYVKEGGGVYVYHSGNNAFASWAEYNEMIGLGWRSKDFGRAVQVEATGSLNWFPPGEGDDTGHGPRSSVSVYRRGEHPIHKGFPKVWLTPDLEIYQFARGPARNLEVLSYGFDEETAAYWPVEWTIEYGKGRIYTSTFGHVGRRPEHPLGMRCVGFRTLVGRVLQWVAGREPDLPLPSDFPSATQVSLLSVTEPLE